MPALTTGRPTRRSRLSWTTSVTGAALMALLLAVGAGPAAAASATVSAQSYVFVGPDGTSSVTIVAGDTVRWTFRGEPHTVTSGSPGSPDGRFDSGIVNPGGTFQLAPTTPGYPFAKPGTYPYFCQIHPEQMHGTIVVRAATTSSPKPTLAATPKATATIRTSTPAASTPPSATFGTASPASGSSSPSDSALPSSSLGGGSQPVPASPRSTDGPIASSSPVTTPASDGSTPLILVALGALATAAVAAIRVRRRR